MNYHLAVAGRTGPVLPCALTVRPLTGFAAFFRLCVLAQFNFVDPGCEGGLVLLILSFTILVCSPRLDW